MSVHVRHPTYGDHKKEKLEGRKGKAWGARKGEKKRGFHTSTITCMSMILLEDRASD